MSRQPARAFKSQPKAKPRVHDTGPSFKVDDALRPTIRKVVDRAMAFNKKYGWGRTRLDIEMDVIATHANGNPMDFEKLLGFDDFNFLHDIGGIARHLNRNTGRLMDCFSPRASKREG